MCTQNTISRARSRQGTFLSHALIHRDTRRRHHEIPLLEHDKLLLALLPPFLWFNHGLGPGMLKLSEKFSGASTIMVIMNIMGQGGRDVRDEPCKSLSLVPRMRRVAFYPRQKELNQSKCNSIEEAYNVKAVARPAA
jgi:hypothetical protein